MKNTLVVLLALIITFPLMGQSGKLNPKATNALNNFVVTASVGTNTLHPNDFSLKNFSGLTMGELNISYKINPRIAIGISSMGPLGNLNSGYFTSENEFLPLANCHDDDDDDMDDYDDLDDDMDDDDINEPYDDDDCDDDDMFGQNLMGSVTILLSDKMPIFVQAAGGYSFSNNAPAYSTLIGYNQKIFAGLGIMGGVRFSDVLHKKPIDAVRLTPTSGIKLELGLTWNLSN